MFWKFQKDMFFYFGGVTLFVNFMYSVFVVSDGHCYYSCIIHSLAPYCPVTFIVFSQDDGILVVPTVADPPMKLNSKKGLSAEFHDRAFALLSIASMSGCCQVTSYVSLHFQVIPWPVIQTYYSLFRYLRSPFHLASMMAVQSLSLSQHSMELINFFLILFWILTRLFRSKLPLCPIHHQCQIQMATWMPLNC